MKLTPADLRGVLVLPPTPCKPGGDAPDATDTVDTDALAWFLENAIQAGARLISLMGTMGEMHTLTRDEWETVVRTAVDVVRRRVPLFCGATTFNTRDSIERTKFVIDAGADGVMNGQPMWLAPTAEDVVQYYRDIAEAAPQAALLIYHNPRAFRVTIPPPAWAQLAKIKQVVAVKHAAGEINNTIGLISAVGDEITVLVGDKQMYPCMMFGAHGGWSTRSSINAHPVLRLYEACERGDWKRAQEIAADVGEDWLPCTNDEFAKYNTVLVKTIINGGADGKAGPTRRPFVHFPKDLEARCRAHGERWRAMAKKYEPAAVPA